MPAIRKACEPTCAPTHKQYLECVDRITAKGEGDCEGQYQQYLICIDKCVSFFFFF